ncbi:MAG: vitamin K epoxide reductase family protein [Actinomycetota bacterium]|nr:vitamin K epoxide reductase family protein [Actinomycetota bacterium]
MDRGPIPPGWDENPAAWSKRLSLAARAFAGLCIATYLALYQVGVFSNVWDPFFGNGSREVLTSAFSRSLPVPDASLGALAYLTEIVLSLIGGRDRWRTMPWTTIALGLVVGLGAVASVLLMIVQPVVAGAWCTLCLASAFVSLTIVGSGLEELLATLQHLKRAHENGYSAWQALWGLGDGGVSVRASRKGSG